MLQQEMVKKLNKQLNLEFFSANFYLQMSAWCNYKGFEGATVFLKTHSQEEMGHMQRLFNYLSDIDEMPILGQIDAPPAEFNSVKEVLKKPINMNKILHMKLMHLYIWHWRCKTTRHLIFCSGMLQNNMKKKSYSNQFWISLS